MISPAIVTALVLLISALVKQFLPAFPISDELIHTVVIALLSWLGLEAGKFFFPAVAAKLKNKRLM